MSKAVWIAAVIAGCARAEAPRPMTPAPDPAVAGPEQRHLDAAERALAAARAARIEHGADPRSARDEEVGRAVDDDGRALADPQREAHPVFLEEHEQALQRASGTRGFVRDGPRLQPEAPDDRRTADVVRIALGTADVARVGDHRRRRKQRDALAAPGDLLLMSGFGAGMTWSSAVVRWQPGPERPRGAGGS